jgi:hypothetical protein
MLRFIGPIFDNALPALTREPLPKLRHVFQLLFQLGIFHLSSCVTTLGGILLVFQDCLHGSQPDSAPDHGKNIAATKEEPPRRRFPPFG